MTGSFTKLRSGDWGLRVSGSPKAGQTVDAVCKNGEMKTMIIGRVLWEGDGIALCTIDRKQTVPAIHDVGRSSKPDLGMCQACGERRAVTIRRDLNGMTGAVCAMCAKDNSISFM